MVTCFKKDLTRAGDGIIDSSKFFISTTDVPSFTLLIFSTGVINFALNALLNLEYSRCARVTFEVSFVG